MMERKATYTEFNIHQKESCDPTHTIEFEVAKKPLSVSNHDYAIDATRGLFKANSHIARLNEKIAKLEKENDLLSYRANLYHQQSMRDYDQMAGPNTPPKGWG